MALATKKADIQVAGKARAAEVDETDPRIQRLVEETPRPFPASAS